MPGRLPLRRIKSSRVPASSHRSYQFRDTEHAESPFALEDLGNIERRGTNPTVGVLEQ